MYFYNEPPVELSQDEFPKISDVVTVANCWYYLSLLERFVDITSSMPEHILKIYLVRAEYRYFQWTMNKSVRKAKYTIPPLDIAFFWQAHMLSPFRFREDTLRAPPYKSDEIPLKKIHDLQKEPNKEVLMEWNRVMLDEPYDLTEKVILENKGYAIIRCIVCHIRIEVPWKEYTQWRTDHRVALQCHCCKIMFTIKHVGKANFLADNTIKQTTAGLLLDKNGFRITSNAEHKLLLPLKDIKSLPFDRGLKPLEDHLRDKINNLGSRRDSTKAKKNLINAIQSTYLCTPYRGSSIDMIQAVARQYKFAIKVTKSINWDIPTGIIKGIRRYCQFLAVIHDNESIVAVPTYEIDLAWHTHMLHAKNYRRFCIKNFSRLINHDDSIPDEKLNIYVEKTNIAWKQRDTRYMISQLPTLPPSPTPSINEKQEVKVKSMKTKIRSLFSFKKKSRAVPKIMPSPPIASNCGSQVATAKDIYCDEKIIFGNSYVEGSYKDSIVDSHVSDTSSQKSVRKMEDQTTNVNPEKQLFENLGEDNDDIVYDKEKISFHDRRDIKDFIKFQNSDKMIDKKFKDVKTSIYGFIGTSNCGRKDKHRKDSNDITVSKYKKVFSTTGPAPEFNPQKIQNISKLERLERHNKVQDNADNHFDWYAISRIWFESTIEIDPNNKKDSIRANKCDDDYNAMDSVCIGVSFHCDTSSLSNAYESHSKDGLSSSNAYESTSNCGGSSSNCGGSSSNCGGSSSNCGGGSNNF